MSRPLIRIIKRKHRSTSRRRGAPFALLSILVFSLLGINSAVFSAENQTLVPKTANDPDIQKRVHNTLSKLPLHFEANAGQTDAQVKFLSRTSGYSLFLTATEAVLSISANKQTTNTKLAPPSVAGGASQRMDECHCEDARRSNRKARGLSHSARSDTIKACHCDEARHSNLEAPGLLHCALEQLQSQSLLSLRGDSRSNLVTVKPKIASSCLLAMTAIPVQDSSFLIWSYTADGAVRHNENGADEVNATDEEKNTTTEASVLRLHWLNANPNPKISGAELQPGKSAYFHGSDVTQWRSDVPHYAKVHYEAVYPGIDLVYYGNQSKIEYDFVVQPGADPNHIRLAIDGADNIRLDADGNLILATANGELLQQAPIIYQEIKGERVPVEGQYVLHANKEVSFQVAAYDTEQTLVIDPILQSSYLGGSGDDRIYALTIDPVSGDVYVGGYTTSSDFPGVTGGPDTVYTAPSEAFVARLNATLTTLLQATYLGGDSTEQIKAIAIHPVSGDVYVAGDTSSLNFPGTTGGAQATANGTGAFIARLNASLTTLTQATHLTGSLPDRGYALAIHPVSGDVYVAGETQSSNFPGTAGGADTIYAGGSEAFVARLNSSLTSLTQATYLGGSGADYAYALAIHPVSGDVYVAGSTQSTNFPGIASGADTTFGGAQEAFIARLNSALTSLTQATFLSGSSDDYVAALAIHPVSGDVYAAGTAYSSDFPGIAGGADTTFGGSSEAFVARLNSALTSLTQATFLGGSGNNDFSESLVIHPASGEVYVAGYGDSSDFPGIAGGADSTFVGTQEGYVARLNSALTSITQATFLGGSSIDFTNALAIHPVSGEVYVAGTTTSNDFPSVTGGAQSTYAGTQDAFITRLTANLSTAPQAMFIADFNSGMLPSQLSVATSPANLTSMSQNVSGGVLNVSAVGAVQTEQLRVSTCFKAVGDYVATVDAVRSVATGELSQGLNWVSLPLFGYTEYFGTGTINGYAGFVADDIAVANAATTAQFRVERVGNTTTSSFNTGTGFTTLQSATDASLSTTNDFGLYLRVNGGAIGGDQTGSFDNFTITAEQFEPALTTSAASASITAGSDAVINASLCGVNPTGTVTVSEGATVLATETLSSGAATINIAGLSVGTHSLTVDYAGDSIHTAVVSAPIEITVNAPSTIIYSNDFETSTAGFDVTNTILLPRDIIGNESTYLGRRSPGSNSAVLTLSGLMPGVVYDLAFDLYIGGTWDGSGSFGPDTFTLSTSSSGILVNATFRNGGLGTLVPSQTYSDATPLGDGGLFRDREGSDVELNEPIYYFGRGAENPLLSFTATGTSEVITFSSVDAQGITDEFFALDNVVVRVNAAVVIENASFEVPDIADNSFVYNPAGASWNTPNSGGIIDPGPLGYFFNFGGTPAPDGSQYGFIQGTAGLSQVVTFPSAGNYLLTFKAAGRPPQNFIADGGNQSYEVRLDTTAIYSGTTTTGSAFIEQAVPFSTTGGAHTLSFIGLNTTDSTAFIDAVSIVTATDDTIPDAFSFTDQADVALSTVITSNTITVSGINTATAISVNGGEYSINSGTFMSAVGTVNNGDTVQVRHTSAATGSTATNTTLTIGAVSDTFTSTTLMATGTPNIDVIQIVDFGAVTLGTNASQAITVSNIGTGDITLGLFSISGGAFNFSGGTCTSNQVLVPSVSCTLVVEFAPIAAGLDTRLLGIEFNDPNSGGAAFIGVTLSGEGVSSTTSADVAITGTATASSVAAGDSLTYTFTVTNDGPDAATGVTLMDILPGGVTFDAADSSVGSCSASGTTVSCAIGNLAASASATVTITVIPNTGGSLDNTAVVSANETDPSSGNNSATVSVDVTTTMTLLPGSLPAATVGSAYSATFTVSGGIQPYTFSISSAVPGLGNAGSTLLGSPSVAGIYSVEVAVQDSATTPVTVMQSYLLTVSDTSSVGIPDSVLPAGAVGASYGQQLTTSGGHAPYTWSTSGGLPPGLTLRSSGFITGVATQQGDYAFPVILSDVNGLTSMSTISIEIQASGVVDLTPALPNGRVAVPFSVPVIVSGGTAPYTCELILGNLPIGLTLDGCNISGIPTTGGTEEFTLRVIDSAAAPNITELTRSITIVTTVARGDGETPQIKPRHEIRLPDLGARSPGGNRPDESLEGLATDAFGSRYVTGYAYNGGTYDIRLLKYDANGKLVWSQIFDSGNHDYGYSVVVSADQSVYVTGFTVTGTQYRALLLKYDSNGLLKWWHKYGDGSADTLYRVAVDETGVYVAGESYNGANFDALIMKVDSEGKLLWTRKRTTSDNDTAYDIAPMPCSAAPCSVLIGGAQGQDVRSGWLMQLDRDTGAVMNDKTVTTDATVAALAVGAAGHVHTGGNMSNGAWRILHLDADLNVLNDATHPINGQGRLRGIALDREGWVYVVGANNNDLNSDALVATFSPEGGLIETLSMDSGRNETGHAIVVDVMQQVVIAGEQSDDNIHSTFLLREMETGKAFKYLTPSLPQLGNVSVLVGKDLQLNLDAYSHNGSALTYAVTDLPSGATFDTSTGIFNWPSADPIGEYVVTFSVSDALTADQSVSETVSISVTSTTNSKGGGSAGSDGGGNGGGSMDWLMLIALACLGLIRVRATSKDQIASRHAALAAEGSQRSQ